MSEPLKEKILIILRGAPGSGKSFKSKELEQWFKEKYCCHSFTVHSADTWFMQGSRYVFDPTELKDAHKYCRTGVESSAGHGVQVIVVDNTNLASWEYKPYIAIADKFGYKVYQLICAGEYENIHVLLCREYCYKFFAVCFEYP